MCKILDIVIIGYIGYSDNLTQNSMSLGLSLYPICTVYNFFLNIPGGKKNNIITNIVDVRFN